MNFCRADDSTGLRVQKADLIGCVLLKSTGALNRQIVASSNLAVPVCVVQYDMMVNEALVYRD